MNMDQSTYQTYAKARAKRSPLLCDCLWAFFVGGSICTVAELFFRLYIFLGIAENNVRILTPVTMVTLAAILTGFGVFDKIAKHAGAGTLVPITGFANAVVSPAIDNRAEGMILGVGAKMFLIAGPVIVYGTLASVLWGIIYYILRLCGVA